MGPRTEQFELEFARRLGLPGLVLLSSGTDALLMALKLLELPPGAEIILPAFTWVGCAHAVCLAGCRPVFCDVDYESQNVTVDTIQPHITPNTAAIMVVHYAGLPVNMSEIIDMGYPVIEDAAHAVDSRHAGRPCGAWGDVGVYSFDAVKNLVMGEGGGVTGRDDAILDKARNLRYCGIGRSGFEAAHDERRWWEQRSVEVFPKMIPSDLCAAVGLAQLGKLDCLQEKRRRIWQHYQQAFSGLEWLARPVEAPDGDQHSYFTYCVRLLDGRRDELAVRLLDRGIYSTLRFQPLNRINPYRTQTVLSTTDRLADEGLCLPLHPGLSDEDMERVIDAVSTL